MPRVSPEYEQNQRKKIMEGASKVFAKYGYGQTTMDQICKALTLSKGAVYTYFKSKEELYIMIMESIFENRYVLLSSSFKETDPFMVKLEKIIDCLESLVIREDHVYARLSVEGFLESDRIESLQKIKADSYNRFYNLLYDLLTKEQEAGKFSPKFDISGMVTVMMATLDGLMMYSLLKERKLDVNQIREAVLGMFSQLFHMN